MSTETAGHGFRCASDASAADTASRRACDCKNVFVTDHLKHRGDRRCSSRRISVPA
jgi:hypothetical protein